MALVARVRRYSCEQGRDLGRRGGIGFREARRYGFALVFQRRLRELLRGRREESDDPCDASWHRTSLSQPVQVAAAQRRQQRRPGRCAGE